MSISLWVLSNNKVCSCLDSVVGLPYVTQWLSEPSMNYNSICKLPNVSRIDLSRDISFLYPCLLFQFPLLLVSDLLNLLSWECNPTVESVSMPQTNPNDLLRDYNPVTNKF